MELTRLSGKCFLCGDLKGNFDTEHRVCGCGGLDEFRKAEHHLYVTILPDLGNYDVSALPSINSKEFADVFAIHSQAPESTDVSNVDTVRRKITNELPALPIDVSQGDAASERVTLPLYSRNHLSQQFGLRCGNPVLYRLPRLEEWSRFVEVYVLDMGTYLWSGTLKDPRSWAIINTALDNGITDLALWTAGNAGLSLAKLAYAVNRSLPADRRIRIYGLVDSEVSLEVRARLRTWQCDVLDIPSKTKFILDPEEIKTNVRARMMTRGQSMNPTRYWHVTDGWDGVGLLMYRFLGAQIIRDLKPVYILSPVGTGDLLLGLYLGLEDCERTGVVAEDKCKIVGVVPAGENILDNIRNQRINPKPGHTADLIGKTPPVMPKLIGRYSPLAPCIYRMELKKKVRFIEVDANDQLAAGGQTLNAGIDLGIACEPSALAAFAGLPYLNDIARDLEAGGPTSLTYKSRSRVLVINSGLGVLSNAEEEVLIKSFST